MCPSFLEQIEQAAKHAKEKEQIALKGSGITKRLIADVNRNAAFEEKKALKDSDNKKAFQDAVIASQEEAEKAAAILRVQMPGNFQYDEYQQAAISNLPNLSHGVLVGSAGTGKTTVTKEIAKSFELKYTHIDINKYTLVKDDNGNKVSLYEKTGGKENMAPPIAFCAYTGRAVQQMKRALPEKYHPLCSTIHALLGYFPEWYDELDEKTGDFKSKMRFIPTFNAFNKLPHKRIVIDEAGMLSVELFNRLVEAITEDCEILFVGDMQQLPPVHGRSILGYAMLNYPTFELKQIHRQAADNPVIANAHRILKGIRPERTIGKFDMGNLSSSSSEAYDQLISAVKALYAKGQFDPLQDAIIVPQNKGTLGQVAINEQLCTFFNPEKKVEGVVINKRFNIKAGRHNLFFAQGDKVMLLQNDNERGLTNGMIGVIESINSNGDYNDKEDKETTGFSLDNADFSNFGNILEQVKQKNQDDPKEEIKESQRQASHVCVVKFADGQDVMFKTAGQYGRIVHAYAFTCHKSQGGEYRNVIVLAHSANAHMLSREWLYTAVTRARERLILFYNDNGMKSALNNQRVRGATLQQKIENFIRWGEEAKDDQIPMLPKLKEKK